MMTQAQRRNGKKNFCGFFKAKKYVFLSLAYYFLIVHSHQSSKIKSHMEVKSQNSRNQGLSYFFLLDDGRIRKAQRTYGSSGSTTLNLAFPIPIQSNAKRL
jgi:hypothetical protein